MTSEPASETDPNRTSAPDIRSRIPRTERTRRTYGAVHNGRLNPYGSRRVRRRKRFTRSQPAAPNHHTRPTARQWLLIWATALSTTLAATILTALGAAK